jgi:sugar O-acyltransferase (sialic acid O-acetyltransferase NeuD family)
VVAIVKEKIDSKEISGYVALDKSDHDFFGSLEFFRKLDDLPVESKGWYFLNGLGISSPLSKRQSVFEELITLGLTPMTLMSEKASVDKDVYFGAGSQVFPGACVRTGAQIGVNAVINTGAIVEHDCIIGEGSFVAPGAIVLGGCKLGNNVLIGAGSIIHPGTVIGDNSVIGSGSLVLSDVTPNSMIIGSPGKKMN